MQTQWRRVYAVLRGNCVLVCLYDCLVDDCHQTLGTAEWCLRLVLTEAGYVVRSGREAAEFLSRC